MKRRFAEIATSGLVSLLLAGMVVAFNAQNLRADALYANESMECGDEVWSDNSIYRLKCTDIGSNEFVLGMWTGTAVMYWDSSTDSYGGYGTHTEQWGSAGPDSYAYMGGDGNFVLYDDGTYSGSAVWSTNTNGNPSSYVNVQNDGNLVVYDYYVSPIWSLF